METAAALPVLDFWIEYRVTNDNPITIVFKLPIKTKNSLFSVDIIEEPMTAACPLPKLGRKEQRGAERIEARSGFFNSGFISFSFVIFCSGIFCFLIILVIKDEPPNNPVSNGRRELFKFKFKVEMPKNPDKRKIINAFVFELFSVEIKKIEAVIKIRNIIFWR